MKIPEMELLPLDVEQEYTPEDMEAAEAEVQEILDRYYGTVREEG